MSLLRDGLTLKEGFSDHQRGPVNDCRSKVVVIRLKPAFIYGTPRWMTKRACEQFSHQRILRNAGVPGPLCKLSEKGASLRSRGLSINFLLSQ